MSFGEYGVGFPQNELCQIHKEYIYMVFHVPHHSKNFHFWAHNKKPRISLLNDRMEIVEIEDCWQLFTKTFHAPFHFDIFGRCLSKFTATFGMETEAF